MVSVPWLGGYTPSMEVDKVKTQGVYGYVVCMHMHTFVRVHCELVAEVSTAIAELAMVQ